MSERVLLVTGASGQLGREVVERLLARGGDRVVAGTRDPAKLADLAARGVEVRRVDFDDEASLAEGFRGVDRLLLVSTDALDVPGRRAEQHARAVKAAAAAGVGHVVYTSATGATPDATLWIARDHATTEAALAASGLSYTALRDNLYAELLLRSLPQAVATGKLVTARADGAVGYVTRSDCAAAAAAALVDTFDGTRTLDVTGAEALTGDDIARIATTLSGRPVVHVPVPPDAYVQGLVGAGFPLPIAELLVDFETAGARGEFAVVADTVERLTGAAPTSVRDFLATQLAA